MSYFIKEFAKGLVIGMVAPFILAGVIAASASNPFVGSRLMEDVLDFMFGKK